MIRWLVRRRQSFGYAFSGLIYMLRTQPHAQVHLLAVVVVVSAGCLTGLAPAEWTVLILSMALVLSLEAMNTALEALADALHPSHHPLVGKAKDLAAAARSRRSGRPSAARRAARASWRTSLRS